jgi:leucyl/phenylalanyl-tRNA--protein transferase
MVGGLYGLELGAAFFGESMFSIERDASKVALVHLAAVLRRGGFQLLDTQFLTEHLEQFGALEIERKDYLLLLEQALATAAEFPARNPADGGIVLSGSEALEFLAAGRNTGPARTR